MRPEGSGSKGVKVAAFPCRQGRASCDNENPLDYLRQERAIGQTPTNTRSVHALALQLKIVVTDPVTDEDEAEDAARSEQQQGFGDGGERLRRIAHDVIDAFKAMVIHGGLER